MRTGMVTRFGGVLVLGLIAGVVSVAGCDSSRTLPPPSPLDSDTRSCPAWSGKACDGTGPPPDSRGDKAITRDRSIEFDKAPTSDKAIKMDTTFMVPGTWVTIPAGTFMMGSPDTEPCREGSEDLHQVTLTHKFEIQTTEVTQAQFKAVMGYNPSNFKACGGTCPVESVTWWQAVKYCNALSQGKGLTPCYTCTGKTCYESTSYTGANIYNCPGYRLPTEAEWEYAYRAGTITAFYNGEMDPTVCYECKSGKDANLDLIAWYCYNSGWKTYPVGLKAANKWGLYDMAGNVDEWCHDNYLLHLGLSATTDPVSITSSGDERVFRGSSSGGVPKWHRAAARLVGSDPYNYRFFLGFRCSRIL
jgi:formylglycine-generating enzyme required for sulfatase activity